MTNLPAVWAPAPIAFKPIDLINIRAMCPPEATQLEFDRFIAMCRARGLDPRLGHAYLFILNARDEKKRSCSVVVSERGYLAAADRCRDQYGGLIFKPDDTPARIEYDPALKDPLANPLGIAACEVAVFKFIQGDWHRIPERVHWDERAPLKEIWGKDEETGKDKPTGKFQIDPGKKNWRTQGRTMIAKCARVAALRLAFPDQFGGLYDEAEMHALESGKIIDLTPTEVVEQAIQQERLHAIGAHKAVPLFFNNVVQNVPLGKVHDRMEEYFRAHPAPKQIQDFIEQNRVGVKQYLALVESRSDWLNLKRNWIDPAAAALKQQKPQEASGGDQDSPPADGDRG